MDIEALLLVENGAVPNNPNFPVLIYRRALPPEGDLAAELEARFAANGWEPAWRDGIYDFHHYHAQGHEVLGIAAGTAELVLGGEGGRAVAVGAGDVLLLPAGTGHRRISASGDLLVVGAYPPGQQGDIRRGPPTPDVRAAISRLPRPQADPVAGTDGALQAHWGEGRAL